MDARIRDQISEIAELSQFLAEEHAKEPKFVKGKMWNGIQIFHSTFLCVLAYIKVFRLLAPMCFFFFFFPPLSFQVML